MKQKALSFEIILLLLFLILFVGCTSQNVPNFEGTSWNMDTYLSNIGHLVSPVSSTKMTLEFKDGRISGSSGCNSFFAKYTVEKNSMSFGLIGATKMYCSNPGVMEQEQTYFMRLDSVETYKIEGDKLKLIDGNGKTVLIFSKN
ncbi:MAG TPA: META domain-containing protein [Methanofastidiosum sp.]|nr:META domain-containing protein [Methanofastidiosum sp.]HNU61514.1 META domain-containing protein [Methanofastidiosum sp.]